MWSSWPWVSTTASMSSSRSAKCDQSGRVTSTPGEFVLPSSMPQSTTSSRAARPATVLEHRHVAADFLDAAERDDAQRPAGQFGVAPAARRGPENSRRGRGHSLRCYRLRSLREAIAADHGERRRRSSPERITKIGVGSHRRAGRHRRAAQPRHHRDLIGRLVIVVVVVVLAIFVWQQRIHDRGPTSATTKCDLDARRSSASTCEAPARGRAGVPAGRDRLARCGGGPAVVHAAGSSGSTTTDQDHEVVDVALVVLDELDVAEPVAEQQHAVGPDDAADDRGERVAAKRIRRRRPSRWPRCARSARSGRGGSSATPKRSKNACGRGRRTRAGTAASRAGRTRRARRGSRSSSRPGCRGSRRSGRR